MCSLYRTTGKEARTLSKNMAWPKPSTFLPHFQVILVAQQRLKRTVFDIGCYLGLYLKNKVSSRVNNFKVSILGWNGSEEEGWQ